MPQFNPKQPFTSMQISAHSAKFGKQKINKQWLTTKYTLGQKN
jgi:hypothetical protein